MWIAALDGDAFKASGSSGSGSGGGSSVRPSYRIEFETADGSEITDIRVKKGGLIEKPEDPVKEGYIFGGWYSDEALTIEFDFDTPVTKGIKLYARWIPEETDPDDKDPEITDPDDKDPDTAWQNPYDDIAESDWYYDAVKFATENGIMNGVADGEFDPNGKLTRGMFVTILHRIENTPEATKDSGFEDVASGAWYEDAVNWATENGIVNGVSATEFKPNDYITREQMAAVIFRFAQYKGLAAVTLSENLHFNDAGMISEYAIPGMNWAAGLEIIKGYGDGNVGPKDNTTRAQAALVLMRMRANNIF